MLGQLIPSDFTGLLAALEIEIPAQCEDGHLLGSGILDGHEPWIADEPVKI